MLLPVNLYHGDGMITTAVQHLPIYISVLDLTDLSRTVDEKQQHTAKPSRAAAGICWDGDSRLLAFEPRALLDAANMWNSNKVSFTLFYQTWAYWEHRLQCKSLNYTCEERPFAFIICWSQEFAECSPLQAELLLTSNIGVGFKNNTFRCTSQANGTESYFSHSLAISGIIMSITLLELLPLQL